MKLNHLLCVATSILIAAIGGSFAVTARADAQAVLHVAPGGCDTNPGTEAEPFATIGCARDAVRAINREMTGDIEVILHDGVYELSETLVFDHRDGGTHGHNVVYRAAAGAAPVISGGRAVTGWKEDAGGRWKAACGEHFRQLYVNDRRAVRAQGAPITDLELYGEDGFRTKRIELAEWSRPYDLEFCYRNLWRYTRLKVASITREGDWAIIRMVQPHFTFARTMARPIEKKNWGGDGRMAVLENALELLDEPGEWYLDRATKTVYYKPLPGEDMATAKVIAPVLEKLVVLAGTIFQPVRNIQFRGLTFAHGTWLEPDRIGLADIQANFTFGKTNLFEYPVKGDDNHLNNVFHEHCKMPANIVCRACTSVHFEGCTFRHLGGAGLDIERGSQDNTVLGCVFRDISGSAVQIGGVERLDHHPPDPRLVVKNNRVLNCLIEHCAVEYKGGVGIFVGYTVGTVIAHNEVRHLPYSGISVGWGWGSVEWGFPARSPIVRFDTPHVSRDNLIEYNHVHHTMRELIDGAGIYTLCNMPGTRIRGNHIHDNPGTPGGIYLDIGKDTVEVTGNLIYRVGGPPHPYLPLFKVAEGVEKNNLTDVPDQLSADEVDPIIQKAGLQPAWQKRLGNP